MPASTLPNSDLEALDQFLASTGFSIGGAGQAKPGMPLDELFKYRASEEGKTLASWVKEKFTRCSTLRFKEERQWNLNLAFYNGNQWLEMTPMDGTTNAGRLSLPAAVKNGRRRQRRTINRIKSIIRTEMAKFISQRPGASVVPATDEDEDILAAKAGERVWMSCQERRKLQDEFIDAVFWMCITGNGFIKTKWDPTITDEDADVPGDVAYESVDPYKLFFPDLRLQNIQEQPYLIHAYAKPVEWLEETYKEQLNGAKVRASCFQSDSIMEAAYARPRGTDDKAFDSAMVYEFWVKPGGCKYMPQGGMLIMIEDVIIELHQEGLPYDHKQYPFAHLHHIKTERLYRASIIEDLIDIQRDYNGLRSMLSESRVKMAKPMLLSPKGSVVASKITNEIGTMVEYKPGMEPPTPLPVQNLPQYVFTEVDYILRDFEDISGQHEVSKGQTPPGVTAATAISYLQESDDSYILPTFKSLEAAYGSIAKQTLKLCVQFWDIERTVKVTGKDEVFSVELLSGADIERGTDVRIEPGSSLPTSKAAKQALIMDLMMNFPDAVPAQKGLDMMEIGSADKLIDELKTSERQAKRENIRFKRLQEAEIAQYEQMWSQHMQTSGMMGEGGEMPTDPMTGMPMEPPLIIPVNDWDDHEIHIEEHNRFRRTQEFEVLPDIVKTAMQSHVEMHRSAMQEAQLQQVLSQIPSDGSTPGISGTMNGTEVDLAGGGMEGMAPEDPTATPGAPTETTELPTEGTEGGAL